MPTSNWTTLPTPAEGPILGIDPGTRFTGWGVIGGSAARPTRIAGGVIRLRSALPLADRLHLLQSELQEIVVAYELTAAAVEAPFHGNNARSALTLAHARGVVLAVLAGAGLTVHEYSPATVKKSVTGNGRADKRQVQAMVSQLLGKGEESKSSDLADAWAVALCHASHRRVAARLGP